MKNVSTKMWCIMKNMKIYLIFIVVYLMIISIAGAEAKTLNVGQGQPYLTIGSAIKAAENCDTILVSEGTYTENLFIRTNGISIIGKNIEKTIIDGGKTNGAIMISGVNDVIISGFTIKNSGGAKEAAGVDIFKANNITVINMNLISNNLGIDIRGSNNIVISGNNIESNILGIYFYVSKNITIFNNNIKNNELGIKASSSENRIFSNNFIDNKIQADDNSGLNSWNFKDIGNYWSDNNGSREYVIASGGKNAMDKFPMKSAVSIKPVTVPTQPCIAQDMVVSVISDIDSLGTGMPLTIKVKVTGNDGAPVSGATVELSTTNGRFTINSGLTDSSGLFTSTFTGNSEGNATVMANVRKDGAKGTNNKIIKVTGIIDPILIAIALIILILAVIGVFLWTRGNLKIVPEIKRIPADGKSTVPITLQFKNFLNKPRRQKKDREVKMETTSGKIQNVIFKKEQESVQATLTSSNECGEVTITATVENQKVSANIDFECIGSSLEVKVDRASIEADGKSTATVSIRVKDDLGNYISYFKKRTVDLTTTLGSISNNVIIPPRTEAVTTVITAGQMNGIATIHASLGNLKGEGKIEFKELPKRFCMHCGTKMSMDAQNCQKCGMIPPSGVDTKECSTCNVILPHTAKFCDKCGARQPGLNT